MPSLVTVVTWLVCVNRRGESQGHIDEMISDMRVQSLARLLAAFVGVPLLNLLEKSAAEWTFQERFPTMHALHGKI